MRSSGGFSMFASSLRGTVTLNIKKTKGSISVQDRIHLT